MQLNEMQSERLLRESLSICKAGEDPDKWVFERNRKDVLYFVGGKAEDWEPITNLEQQQSLLDSVSSYTVAFTLGSIRYQSETVSLTMSAPRVANHNLRGILCVLFVIAHQSNTKIKTVINNEGDMFNLYKQLF